MPAPFYEFAGNKRLLWIAEEWVRYADDLEMSFVGMYSGSATAIWIIWLKDSATCT